MFGSKLRSWMENHIVRPRKKGNKNKNGTSNNLVSANTTQNGHKGTTGISIYQSDISTTTAMASSSPARRSEVSPIQSHTTSRFGWQSPQQETAMSPKSDQYLYMHSVKAHTLSSSIPLHTSTAKKLSAASPVASPKTLSPQSMPRKSSYTQSQDGGVPLQRPPPSSHSSHQQITNHLLNMKNQQPPHIKQSTSTNSSTNAIHNTNHHQKLSTNITYAASNGSISATGTKVMYTCTTNINQIQNQNDINYKNNNNNNSSSNHKHNILSSQQQQHHQQQQQQYNQQQPQHQLHQQQHLKQNQQHLQHHYYASVQETGYQNGSSDENRYGKILPSKQNQLENFAPASIKNYDTINANIQFQSLSSTDSNKSHANNNNSSSQGLAAHPKQASIGNGVVYHQKQHQYAQNSQQPPSQQKQQHQSAGSQVQTRTGSETNRNMLRTNRYNGNSMLAPANTHPLAHVINSLSSPESAYSTGYSTDGTSPGATYTPPEYYINIRTGTHYFPKSVNTLAIEANRYKFGLNKIEEMSPQDPLPNSHRRTESFDLSQNKIPGFGIPDTAFFAAQNLKCNNSSPIAQRNIAIQNYKGFESPSPRQRCRIRTNPWYSTTETSSSTNSSFLTKKIEMDASSSSSGIKSSSDAGASDKNEKNDKSSDSETSSSSTEVEVPKKTFSPGTIRRRKLNEASKSETAATHSMHQESDEDATLNEMMGKFDESYVYEKETDILSDSDPTDCASDLDTGQDAGDECDTDELLDIDFIDNGSIQEISDKDPYKNTGSCSYFNYQMERRASRLRRSRKQNEDSCSSKRRKRLLKTRKKSSENKDRNSPIRNSRESRSLGGTPVCLRRNQSVDSKKYDSIDLELGVFRFNRDLYRASKILPLTNRCNSLTFTEVHAIRSRFLAIAESEKALLKADLEADVKYKQLIHEAETILVSMKTSSSTLRETPVPSPRRVCNPPANKRVEMLRNCEADLKRESCKQQPLQQQQQQQPSQPQPLQQQMHTQKSVEVVGERENGTAGVGVDGVLINKRLEMLRYETNSAPNSPKCCRFSPRKTHVTNFINQNAEPVEISRRNSISDPPIKSPQLQINGHALRSPSHSPSQSRRRFRSQSPRATIYSDSDSDEDNSKRSVHTPQFQRNRQPKQPSELEINGNRKKLHDFDGNEKMLRKSSQQIRELNDDLNNSNVMPEIEKLALYDQADYTNRNITATRKSPLMSSFRSFDMGNRTSVNSYCPQSEPLKRKIYKGSSTFERIKKSLDLEDEIPKKAILDKISNMRREREALKNSTADNSSNQQQIHEQQNCDNESLSNITTKRQLILNTIEDLKRSLEDQSVELVACGGINEDGVE